jgi:hypothetical protein
MYLSLHAAPASLEAIFLCRLQITPTTVLKKFKRRWQVGVEF